MLQYISMQIKDTESSPGATVRVAPYVSFKTFQSGVQALRSHGLPEKIDRSVWLTKSGADQTALLSAFRFLGLIDEKDRVQPPLEKLVDVPEGAAAEKEILGTAIRQSYAELFQRNLETITPAQLAESIGKYGPTGSTRDRAVRFFLKVAGHCGVKISGRLTARKTRGSASAKTNGNGSRKTSRKATPPPGPEQRQDGAAAMKVIELPQAGGSLTLSGAFNPFELVGAERDLVYSIIDLMQEFEAKIGKATTEETR